LKSLKNDLVKALSVAIGLVIALSLVGLYVIPSNVFVFPGHSFYVSGIVDSKWFDQYNIDGSPQTQYTVSVRLFEDDPVNTVKAGETLSYVVDRTDWEMIEWGDTVKIRLLPKVGAEIVDLFPALKPASWHETFSRNLSISLVTDKSFYKLGENVNLTVSVANGQGEETWNQTIRFFEVFPFWAFKDGQKVFASANDSETQEVFLQRDQEVNFNFHWELVSVPDGILYLRVYLGCFSDRPEIVLTATTMIGIES
jgi:hypothetical protein